MPAALLAISGAALTVFTAWGLGRAAWRRESPGPLYELASGTALLSLALFFTFQAGVAGKPAFCILLLFAVVGWYRYSAPVVRLEAPWLALAIAAPFAALYFVNALAPAIQPDEITYHLGLPGEWLRHGGFVKRVAFYESMPQGMEVIFAMAVSFGGLSAAKLVHLVLLFAGAGATAGLGEQLGLSRSASLAGAALYALTPVVGITGSSAYNEAGLVFLTVMAVRVALLGLGRMALLQAGLLAGACYGIKFPGIFVLVLVAAIIWRERGWQATVLVLVSAGVVVAIWMARAWWLAGNPLAPLANSLFPNDAFHAATEASLMRYMRDYGGVTWPQIPAELLWRGERLQGLLGPIWIVVPLSLLALRTKAGRVLLFASVVLLIPWTRNIGARFLMPALPFLGLAIASAIPGRVAFALVALHAVLSWPAVIERYADPHAWTLKDLPWRAALRLEPEPEYLLKQVFEYKLAQRLNRSTRSNVEVLDLQGLPYAYMNTVPEGPLSSRLFDNIVETLRAASMPVPDRLSELRADLPLEFVRGLRVRLLQSRDGPFWQVAEVKLRRNGQAVPISPRWFVDASVETPDAWLAFDQNPASSWSTWRPGLAGDEVILMFDRPVPLDGVAALLPNSAGDDEVALEVLTMNRQWKRLPTAPRELLLQLPLRREAGAFLKNRGIGWIVVRNGGEGYGMIGQSMSMAPQAWGVEPVESRDDLRLFRVR